MDDTRAARRRVYQDVRKNLEDQRLALALLVRRLEPSVEAGRWLVSPADVREDVERGRRALRE